MVDDELAGVVSRALEGITVNEDTIALDVIKKVATSEKKGVNYLSEKHTRKYMHEELYIPKLINRDRRSTWRKKGSLDIIQVAGNRVKQILQSFNPPELDGTIEKKLLHYIENVEKRSLEEYKIAEGMSGGSVSLPGTDIKIDDN
ncbi:MAG: trimethylamine methyltransferase family protein [Promethearchaeota archaeon]